jgi:hypothetical protein
MGKFEDELWTDLMQAHGDELAATQRPLAPRGRVRPLALTAGAASVIALGTAMASTLTATTSAPAYAVTENPDGTVSVTIHDIIGITGANAKLAALGVRARALTFGPDCTQQEHPGLTHPPAPGTMAVSSSTPDEVTFRPSAIPVGDTLVLAAKVADNGRVAVRIGLVLSPAPSCFRVGHPISVPGQGSPSRTGSAAPTPSR